MPYVVGDTLYFHSRSTTTDAGVPFGGLDLYRAEILGAGVTGSWRQVLHVGTGGDESHAAVTVDGAHLYFARRDGGVNQLHAARFDASEGGGATRARTPSSRPSTTACTTSFRRGSRRTTARSG
ncbi:MAG: hypothetical protein KF850_34810 [Labilithrix sp.]|nr:hypothetical protein [Labilithrix sp.]MBX3217254.1 hypothetical protein [Labilithrix sp.]